MRELNQIVDAIMRDIEAADEQNFAFHLAGLIDRLAKLLRAYWSLEAKTELWRENRPKLLKFRESFVECLRRGNVGDPTVWWIESADRPSLGAIASTADSALFGSRRHRQMLERGLTAYLQEKGLQESMARYEAIRRIRDVLKEGEEPPEGAIRHERVMPPIIGPSTGLKAIDPDTGSDHPD